LIMLILGNLDVLSINIIVMMLCLFPFWTFWNLTWQPTLSLRFFLIRNFDIIKLYFNNLPKGYIIQSFKNTFPFQLDNKVLMNKFLPVWIQSVSFWKILK
jgi:hypothetical protein